MSETEIPIPAGTLEGLGDLTEGFLDCEHRDRDGTPSGSDHAFPQTSLDTIQKAATAVSQSCRLNYTSGVTPYQPTRPGLLWSRVVAVFVESINSSKWTPSREEASNEVQMPDQNRGQNEVLQNDSGSVHGVQMVHYSPGITYKPSRHVQESRRRKSLARKRTKLGLDQVNLFPYPPPPPENECRFNSFNCRLRGRLFAATTRETYKAR